MSYRENLLNYVKDNYLNWFYGKNPNGPATLIVAHEGDLWIGLIVLIPITLYFKQQEQRACFAVNVLTHPEHRAKNLFVKMIWYLAQKPGIMPVKN